MIRVVIDTNILASALLTSGSLPEAVIDLAISGEVLWFASESVLLRPVGLTARPEQVTRSKKSSLFTATLAN
jgi:predicted nucleic acid-binding protein